MSGRPRPDEHGDVIVRANIGGTMLFAVTAITAAVLFTSAVQWVGAVVAMGLFLVGIAAFMWSFWNAVQRSRGEQVAVTQLYLLAGGVAPHSVRRLMMSLLAVQVVTGLATALARPNSTDGTPGTSLALGVLVPVFGLGLNGLWAAFHGTYRARTDGPPMSTTSEAIAETIGNDGGSATSPVQIDQNDDHG